jgi:hypothetical protein
MRIKLITSYLEDMPGAILEVDGQKAKDLVTKGRASYLPEEIKRAENKMIDTSIKRKRVYKRKSQKAVK